MHWTDSLIVLLYLVGTALVPALLARRQRQKDDFMLAGKKMHWFPLALAEVAAGFSAISLLGAPGFVMANDLRYLPTLFLGLPTLPIIYYFIVPRVYRLQLVSVYSYLEARFCPAFRYVALVIFIVGKLGYLAMAIYTPALALGTVTGLPVSLFVVIMGVVTAILTMVSGMEGVVWQDVVQYFVIVAGILGVILFFCLGGGGTVADYWHLASAAGKTRVLDFSFGLEALSVWAMFLNAMLLGIAGTCSDQSVVQRWSSAKSLGDAMKSSLGGYVFGTPVVLALYFIGICLFGFCQGHPLPAEIAGQADRAFPYFAVTWLPRGLCGLLLAGILAAGMSTIGAVLHSLTSLFMVDIWEKLHPDAAAQGKSYVRLSRLVTLAWGVLAVLTAFYVMRLGDSIIEVSAIVTSFLSAPLGGVFILGMFTKRANTVGTLIGVAAGVIVAVASWAVNKYGIYPINFMWFGVFSLLATCGVGYLASLPTARNSHAENG